MGGRREELVQLERVGGRNRKGAVHEPRGDGRCSVTCSSRCSMRIGTLGSESISLSSAWYPAVA